MLDSGPELLDSTKDFHDLAERFGKQVDQKSKDRSRSGFRSDCWKSDR
jgi:hypothetical protein